MDERNKWIIRIGSFILLVGFFLPFATVSCVGVEAGSFSISDIAQYFDKSGLYLCMVIYIGVAVLSFLPVKDLSQKETFFWVEIGGLAASAVILLATLSSLNDQTYGTLEFSPNIGFFSIIAGYIAAGWGVIVDHSGQPSIIKNEPSPVRNIDYKKINAESCRLELIQGDGPRIVQVTNDRFFIGRGTGNDLVLLDSSVSRSHAVLRFAQGNWYIQDQESKGGLFLNGKRIQAGRLSEGDRISIGGQVFVFHS